MTVFTEHSPTTVRPPYSILYGSASLLYSSWYQLYLKLWHQNGCVYCNNWERRNKAATDSRELFLGLLYSTEEHKIFGYAPNTKVKFVVVLPSSNASFRDNDVRMMFRKLHLAYSNAVCNPFYLPGDEIISKTFDSSVNEIMEFE
ncbi:trafficking protein particle complex subunit 2-like protein isoform X2 [Fopius arisanus]|uniref:Trafficking protein particle complex subunit 2-like protein n=1 Tax=Fopius arisanus TaxID=64838 RepID=A0A9R1ST78_9HYME|nr:PREDICTED: trafficking protein particle complex subunit 2-like protein isoform X2 [Fopius arisanus]